MRSGTFVITNAGSGYIEQPTVTFSGGGGSGAAAFVNVGTVPNIKSLSNQFGFQTSMGTALSLQNYGANQTTNYFSLFASATGNPAIIEPRGDTNVDAVLSSRGTGAVRFYTNGVSGGSAQEQMRVSHTASAVNYVQVTGGITSTGIPRISAQGSDATASIALTAKSATIWLESVSGFAQAAVTHTASANNYLTFTGGNNASPNIGVASASNADIDLTLTPKGTGNVRFGTRTASADVAITGYIEIKDAGGTVRRLAVVG
jgi:hypothetical protein